MTAAEQREAEKLERLFAAVGLEPERLADYPRRDRVGQLQRMQRQTVVGAVLFRYTYIDEILSCVIAWDFFDRSLSFARLWRRKRFKAFNYFVLDQLYLAQKLKLVQYLHPVPKKLVGTIMALNELRNALAHSFFPENRRQKPQWRGRLIFDPDALEAFTTDTQGVVRWFWDKGLLEPKRRSKRSAARRRTTG